METWLKDPPEEALRLRDSGVKKETILTQTEPVPTKSNWEDLGMQLIRLDPEHPLGQ